MGRHFLSSFYGGKKQNMCALADIQINYLKTILIAALSRPFHIDNDERQNRKLRYLLQTSHCRLRR
jgi:hypothetical protein